MKLGKIITLSAAAALTIALSHFAVAQQQTDRSSGAQTGSQGGGAGSANPGMTGQGGDDTTLEIAPQPGATMQKPGVEEIPTDRGFHPGEDDTDVEPGFRNLQALANPRRTSGPAISRRKISGRMAVLTSASPCSTRRSAIPEASNMDSRS